jgi:hypothetical protein
MENTKNAYKISVGNPQLKRSLEEPRRTREVKTKIIVKGATHNDWIDLN